MTERTKVEAVNERNIYLKQLSRINHETVVSKRATEGCNSAAYTGPENNTNR